VCGIAGAFRFDGSPLNIELSKMLSAIAYRGPDAQRIEKFHDGFMGANRLAIVDVEGGKNPIADETKRYWVALNGEIYNHGPLRKELSARGACFETATDTEVVARLFLEQPETALDRLRGMFAMAIYDSSERKLLLVRDRLGQKPLYWTRTTDGTFLYASELSGLLVQKQVPRNINHNALSQLLLSEYIAAPDTIYEGIHKLEAGTALEIDASGIRVRRWWNPPIPGVESDGRSVHHLSEAVWGAFQISVLHRMEAEVPLGYLLSGGLDSSAVCAMAAEKSKTPLRSFSMGFTEKSFDESSHAEQVAKHLGTDHTTLHFPSSELNRVLEHMRQHMSEPLTDGGYPAMWFLCEQVSNAGLKVVLSGDGADEHFGGYPTYFAHSMARLAQPAHGFLSKVVKGLPASTDNLSRAYLARRFVAGTNLPIARRNQVWLGAFLPSEIGGMLYQDTDPWAACDRWAQIASQAPQAGLQAMFVDQRLYLAEGVLQKVDRASMAHGLEVRSPFLDHEFIDLAGRLPPKALWRGRQSKVLMRQMLKGKLPEAILKRPKKGFGTPLAAWLKGPLAPMLQDLSEQLDGLVRPEFVNRLVQEHSTGHRDHRRRLWTLLVLSRWRNGPWGPQSHH